MNEDVEMIMEYIYNDKELEVVVEIPHSWAPVIWEVGLLAIELLIELIEVGMENDKIESHV